MDKHRAYTKIEKILYSKDYEDITPQKQEKLIIEVLQKLQSYNYDLGKRHGMFKAVNLLTDFAEKEGKE